MENGPYFLCRKGSSRYGLYLQRNAGINSLLTNSETATFKQCSLTIHQDSSKVGISLNAELIQLGLAITTGYSLPLFKSSWKSLELPKIGETFTWFNEKGEIFLQDVRYKPELDYIREYLYEMYENTRSTESDLIFSPGDLCIVKYIIFPSLAIITY